MFEKFGSYSRRAKDAVVTGCKKVAKGVKTCCTAIISSTGSAIAGTGATIAGVITAKQASAQVTLPDVGVDVSEYATAMGTDLGAVFVTILGISVAFMIATIGWFWLRRLKR